MPSPLNLPALRALAEKATPGPWTVGRLESYAGPEWRACRYFYRGDNDNENTRTRVYGGLGDNGQDFDCDADASFIAAANPATILRLLDEVDAARRVVEEMREIRNRGTGDALEYAVASLGRYDAAVAKGEA